MRLSACRRARRGSRLPRAPDTPTSAREDPRAEVGEEVRVGVDPVEFSFIQAFSTRPALASPLLA